MRTLAFAASITLLCLGVFVSPMPAYANCGPGWGTCTGTNKCAPLGADCCTRFGRDTHCKPGNTCHRTGGCCRDGQIHTATGCLDRSSERVCTDGSYCNAGSACIGGNKCLATTSARYCGNRQYCQEGYECAGAGKCRPIASASPTSPSPGGSDGNSGVKDARHCIDVELKGATMYAIKNTCTFGVNIKLRTMDFSPKTTSDDSYYLGAGSDTLAISYHDYEPEVVSACGKGSVC